MKYFNVYFDESANLGSGRSRSKDLLFFPDHGQVTNWVVLQLDLVHGDFPDYLSSDLGCRICSDKMRRILDSTASSADSLQWLPVDVIRVTDVRRYWILHFPKPVEALGPRSILKGDFVVKPVFSIARLQGHAVLTFPGSEGVSLLIDENVKQELERESCTGLECVSAALEP